MDTNADDEMTTALRVVENPLDIKRKSTDLAYLVVVSSALAAWIGLVVNALSSSSKTSTGIIKKSATHESDASPSALLFLVNLSVRLCACAVVVLHQAMRALQRRESYGSIRKLVAIWSILTLPILLTPACWHRLIVACSWGLLELSENRVRYVVDGLIFLLIFVFRCVYCRPEPADKFFSWAVILRFRVFVRYTIAFALAIAAILALVIFATFFSIRTLKSDDCVLHRYLIFFGGLYVVRFLLNFVNLTAALAAASFRWAKGRNVVDNLTVLKSAWIIARYHLGSVAFSAIGTLPAIRAALMNPEFKFAIPSRFKYDEIGCKVHLIYNVRYFADVFVGIHGVDYTKAIGRSFDLLVNQLIYRMYPVMKTLEQVTNYLMLSFLFVKFAKPFLDDDTKMPVFSYSVYEDSLIWLLSCVVSCVHLTEVQDTIWYSFRQTLYLCSLEDDPQVQIGEFVAKVVKRPEGEAIEIFTELIDHFNDDDQLVDAEYRRYVHDDSDTNRWIHEDGDDENWRIEAVGLQRQRPDADGWLQQAVMRGFLL